MPDLIRYAQLLTQQIPVAEHRYEYVGESLISITDKHPNRKLLPYLDEDTGYILLEIRLEKETLACIIKNNICVEAYIFNDQPESKT